MDQVGILAALTLGGVERDLEDLPEDVRRQLDIHLVEELGDVLTLALRGARFQAGHLVFEADAPVEPKMVSKN